VWPENHTKTMQAFPLLKIKFYQIIQKKFHGPIRQICKYMSQTKWQINYKLNYIPIAISAHRKTPKMG